MTQCLNIIPSLKCNLPKEKKNTSHMKTKVTIYLFFLLIAAEAQNPQGKLFIYEQKSSGSEKDILGCIQYPSLQYSVIDTTELSDMAVYNSSLYIANKNVYIYKISTLTKVDSIVNTDAGNICIWNDKLICSCDKAPYFRVYDILNNHSTDYVIDTPKISQMAMDMVITDDLAFLTIDTTVLIIDLVLKDTLAYIPVNAPLTWAGYSAFLINAMGDVYVDLEYWTGAPRFSFVKVDNINLRTDSVFHVEMNMNVYKPQAANDKIYLTEYPSYYDITTDSLHMSGFYSPYAIEYDSSSGYIFVYDDISNTILCYDDTTIVNTLALTQYLKNALWYPESITSIHSFSDKINLIDLYPVPAHEKINITISESFANIDLVIYDAGGQAILSKKVTLNDKSFYFNISSLVPGLYFIEMESSGRRYSGKFIKVK